MPEYLSPGVYVEEVEIGAKPIEGVSTSTAGFVGVAQRGPLNKPTLVTSFGEYRRRFGGYLDKNRFKDVWYLPYAVQGFFENGGKRVFITRVAGKSAKSSEGLIPNISGAEYALDEDTAAKDLTLKLQSSAGLVSDDLLMIKEDKKSEFAKYLSAARQIGLDAALENSYTKGQTVSKLQEDAPPVASTLANDAKKDATEIELADASGFEADGFLLIDDGGQSEVCSITQIDGSTVRVSKPLKSDHASGKDVKKMVSGGDTTQLLSDVKSSAKSIPVPSDAPFAQNEMIVIGKECFIIKSSDADNVVLIESPLKYDHKKVGTVIKKLAPAIKVSASSEGTWGDRVEISVARSEPVKITVTEDAPLGQTHIDVDTVASIYAGTILKLPENGFVKVEEVIHTPDQKRLMITPALSAVLNKDTVVETEAFDLVVGFEGRDEVFKNLSLQSSHPNYVETAVNSTSGLISVKDVSNDGSITEKIVMPSRDKSGKWYWRLSKGDDGIPAGGDIDTVYEGKESDEPKERTGLYTFKNIDEINIVAVPGIVSQHIQNKIVSHCENMKDRFGVLDPTDGATLDDIQKQRNLYDSEYAALYYPWIKVFNPLSKKNEPIPPSGHIIGVYARSDIERGVHKAPANEKLNGVIELGQTITTGQQDILNPKGINCIRAFPGRGIRVWGARTLSSDPLWKYINVRRLFLYLEESIDEGTQWVVFEPNSEILWARVKQTITNFLTRVWKDGALMGTTPEEAFFVKCDRTTMTQDDIDKGRLICLIGVAPVKPAEFVIFRIAQWTGGSEASE